MFSKLRNPFSGLSHLFAAIAAGIGLIALIIIGWGDVGREVSLVVYGLSLIVMFSASATYHMTLSTPKCIETLRKIDHSAIYLLIAGTYTPICFNWFNGFWKWGLLAIVWSLALIGVGFKAFVINTSRWVTAGIYLIMGWLCVIAVKDMLTVLPLGMLVWLLIGGIAFSLGAVVYMARIMDFVPGIFGFHEIWHIFVILGVAAHFTAIIGYII